MEKGFYDELMLGERAVKAYYEGKSPVWIAQNLPTYLNTHQVFAGLTTTDLMIAAKLGGINTFLMGAKESGKSQLANDFAQFHHGGKIQNGGEALIVEAHNDFELEPLFVGFDVKTGEKFLRGTHKAVFYNIEEFPKAHPLVANQFYAFGNGRLILNGFDEPLGREGYSCAWATGNDPRSEAYKEANFQVDPALLSRFPLVLDLDDANYRTTEEDRFYIARIKPPTSSIVLAKQKANLTDKIIQAHNKIIECSIDLGTKAEAVFAYISEGLSRCPGFFAGASSKNNKPSCYKKDFNWPNVCIECKRKSIFDPTGKRLSLCRNISSIGQRVLGSARKYASALDYLIKLKNPQENPDPVDLAFLAFELTGAYQGILNEHTLRNDFMNRNNSMMREIVDYLKSDFMANGDRIVKVLNDARERGKK